jgi:uncharacterized protein (DUF302 family)
MPPYHFSVTVHEEFSITVAKTRQALEDHGFGVVSEIDLAAVFEEKLGLAHPPHLILGACNPGFAKRAVDIEPAISVLLPCQVVVRSIGVDRVTVDFMDPAVLVDLVGEQMIHDIAEDVRGRLEMVRDTVATAMAVA